MSDSGNEVSASSSGEEEQPALDASETESDDESVAHDDASSDDSEPALKQKTKGESITENIYKKYEERQGKQLYIRFPHKIPEDDAEFQDKTKALSPLIIQARKPRQAHARFCLVDFNSKEDRDTALKNILAASKKNKDYAVVASIPRTENPDFVKELAEKKLKSIENKKAKARLRRASKLTERTKNFTSSIVVLNLPKSASVAEIRKLFPSAVDLQLKPKKKGDLNGGSVAAITMPSTMEASAAVRQKLSLDGTKLVIRYDIQKLKKPVVNKPSQKIKSSHKKTKAQNQNTEENSEPSQKVKPSGIKRKSQNRQKTEKNSEPSQKGKSSGIKRKAQKTEQNKGPSHVKKPKIKE